MFKNRTIEAAFPSGIWQQEVEDAEALNAELRRHIAAIPNKIWIENVWQSEDTLHERPEFSRFCGLAIAACHDVLKFLKMEYEDVVLTGCWANMYRKSGVGPHHTHPNNYLSGVYYVAVPEGAGNIEFADPRVQAGVIMPRTRKWNKFTGNKVAVPVMPGRMVIFPAWLSHSVPANVSAEERVSISFNIMLTRYTETMSATLWKSGSAPLRD